MYMYIMSQKGSYSWKQLFWVDLVFGRECSWHVKLCHVML